MSATSLAYVPSFTAQTDTNDLIAAHLAGDERAFTRLVTRYQPRLVNFVTRMIQDRERAEDLVQEAFLRVYRHLNRFDPSRKFSTWVYTIASNLARNELRNRKRSPLVLYQTLESASDTGAPIEFEDPDNRPDELYHQRHLRELVDAAVDRLGELRALRGGAQHVHLRRLAGGQSRPSRLAVPRAADQCRPHAAARRDG